MNDFKASLELLGDETDLQYDSLINELDYDSIYSSPYTKPFTSSLNKPKSSSNFTYPFMILSLATMLIISFDIKEKISSNSTDTMIEVQECARLFSINRCLDKVPLTEQMCLKWEKCIAQDLNSYSILQTFSALLALVIKSFFENLQINSFGMILLTGALGLYLFKKLV